jgi:hypothetical protein
MKWVSVKTGLSGEGYELWAADKKLAGITFSTHTRIARLVSNMGKRLFFFEKRGLLAHSTIIRNEYGIKMGEVEEERNGNRMARLEMDGKTYFYENNWGELKVYDETMSSTLLNCNFKSVDSSVSKTKSLLNTKLPSLLLVLCWYSFQPQGAATPELVA